MSARNLRISYIWLRSVLVVGRSSCTPGHHIGSGVRCLQRLTESLVCYLILLGLAGAGAGKSGLGIGALSDCMPDGLPDGVCGFSVLGILRSFGWNFVPHDFQPGAYCAARVIGESVEVLGVGFKYPFFTSFCIGYAGYRLSYTYGSRRYP